MKQDYKKTSLGIIPNEWKIYELNDIIEISKNKFNPLNNNTQRCIELEHVEQDTGFLLGYTNSTLQKALKIVLKKVKFYMASFALIYANFIRLNLMGFARRKFRFFKAKK